jgi:predicted O-methyltransferase YrrM
MMFDDFYDIDARDGKDVKFIDPDYDLDLMPLIMQSRWELTDFITRYIKAQPKTVLEIGVAHGGTMIQWLKYANDDGCNIVGIEYTKARVERNLSYWESFKKPETNFRVFTGRSQKPEIVEEVCEIFKDGLDWLFIDGMHHYDTAKEDFINYGPLVKPGGIIALHDIYREFDQGSDETVTELWEEIRHSGYMTRELRSFRGQSNRGIGIVYVE